MKTQRFADQQSTNAIELSHARYQIHHLLSDEIMLPILEFIDENVIGRKMGFVGPYGQRRGKFCG